MGFGNPSLTRMHKPHKADGLKSVATTERMENRREAAAIFGGERFVDFTDDIERHQMREISAR